MNKSKRNQIKEAMSYINMAKSIVFSVKSQEEFDFDSLSEGLQATMRGQTMEECIEYMDIAIENLEEALDNLEVVC